MQQQHFSLNFSSLFTKKKNFSSLKFYNQSSLFFYIVYLSFLPYFYFFTANAHLVISIWCPFYSGFGIFTSDSELWLWLWLWLWLVFFLSTFFFPAHRTPFLPIKNLVTKVVLIWSYVIANRIVKNKKSKLCITNCSHLFIYFWVIILCGTRLKLDIIWELKQ